MAQKIQDYTVVQANTVEKITASVQDKLREGWQPWGNLVASGPGRFYQVVVRYSDEAGDGA